MLLFAAPLGLMPYLVALVVWMGLGVFALRNALKHIVPELKWAALVMPAGLLCFWCGQHSLLLAAGILAVFHWRSARPVLAGIVLGAMTVKPQLGWLFIVLLLAERNWRCLVVAVATTLLLVAVTAACFGVEVLRAYVEVGVPAQSHVLREMPAIVAALMPTVFAQLRVLGAGYDAAMLLQVMVAAVMVVVSYRVFRKPHASQITFAWLMLATLLATPYVMAYDTLPLAIAALWFAARVPLRRWQRLSVVGILFLPFITIVGVTFGVPLALLPLAAFGVMLAKRLRADVAAAEAFRPID